MPFLPEQMSPESLRRLVKAQRRALSTVLRVDATQTQAQEVLARTFGFEHWHELQQRLQKRPPPTPYALEKGGAQWMDQADTLMVMGDTHLAATPEEAAKRVSDNVSFHLDPNIRVAKLPPLGDVMSDHPSSEEDPNQALERMAQVADRLQATGAAPLKKDPAPAVHDPNHLAPSQRFEDWFPHVTPDHLRQASSTEVGMILGWLMELPDRLKGLSFEHQRALDRRLADPETPRPLTAARDALLETAWNDRPLFACTIGLIPTNQIWPWLHRAALARNLAMMTRIHEARERAIGSEPFHALANAVFNRDGEHVNRLIEAQCRRYGLAVDDLGGERRGNTPTGGPTRPASSRRRP